MTRGLRYSGFTDIRPFPLDWAWVSEPWTYSWGSTNPNPWIYGSTSAVAAFMKNSLAPVALFDLEYDDLKTGPIMNSLYPSVDEGKSITRNLVLYNDELQDASATIEVNIKSGGNIYAAGNKTFSVPLGEHLDVPISFQVPYIGNSNMEMELITKKGGVQKFKETKIFKVKDLGLSGSSSGTIIFSNNGEGGTDFPVVLEAEDMTTKTTGGQITGGWNLWSNGYIESAINFPEAADYDFDIIAYGSFAAAAWSNMELRIDQIPKAFFTAGTNSWSTYSKRINVPAGTHRIAVAFTNDFQDLSGDRNLYIDKAIIKKTADTTPPADVNQDTKINIQDIQICVKVITGTLTNSRADVNGDGVKNIKDIQQIVRTIVSP
jgi:hypothetical protein